MTSETKDLPALNNSTDTELSGTASNEKQPKESLYSLGIRLSELRIVLILTALSVFTRIYRLNLANYVVWDEAHFGKFGAYYLKGQFYHDVHPPLGKMLVALSGALVGNNGDFKFESGHSYPSNYNYYFMRFFISFFGSSMVPLAYLTARNLKLSIVGSIFAAFMVLLDNALCVISRFILLDPMLLGFTALTFYCHTSFHNYQNEPFSKTWWFWLLSTGISLGLVSSVKWVGFFIVALVGIYTIEDLYDKIGNLEMPKKVYLFHWASRILSLIVIPLVVYMFCFLIHFAILRNSGTGDSNMPSLFQAKLRGTSIGKGPRDIAYGSKITLKNYGMGGGLLHSHMHSYPTGSNQQQVTCYHHKDENNDWIIFPVYETTNRMIKEYTSISNNSTETNSTSSEFKIEEIFSKPKLVENGDIIRLVHASTSRNLHSHRINAPVTEEHYEVSCYGNKTLGDTYDYWRVEIQDDLLGLDSKNIHILSTRFRLRHVSTKCVLAAYKKTLPDWGWGQVETVCNHNEDTSEHTLWNVEDHVNSYLPSDASSMKRGSPFLNDFVHLNYAMMSTNNALVPDYDKIDDLASQPYHWPLLLKGLRMCGWDDNLYKYFMFGNPLVWWMGSLSVMAILPIALLYRIIQYQRGEFVPKRDDMHRLYVSKTIIYGWILHYLPFYIMGRVMYLHHYFPALYFSIFGTAFFVDEITRRHGLKLKALIYSILFVSVFASFMFFSPITFGYNKPSSNLRNRQWLSTWRFSN